MVASLGVSSVLRYLSGNNNVNTEGEDSPLLRSVIGKQLVKAEWGGLACAVVICKAWKLVKVLWLLVLMICKWSINRATNPNPSIVTHACGNIVAHGAVAMQQPWDGHIYQDCFWATTQKTYSHSKRHKCNNRRAVFSIWSMPRCYKQGTRLKQAVLYRSMWRKNFSRRQINSHCWSHYQETYSKGLRTLDWVFWWTVKCGNSDSVIALNLLFIMVRHTITIKW
jgi:hypothetical protein